MLYNFVNGLLTTVNKSCQTCVIFFNVFYPKDCNLDNILSNHIHLCSISTTNLITNNYYQYHKYFCREGEKEDKSTEVPGGQR